jgi:integrase/recombinase XerD
VHPFKTDKSVPFWVAIDEPNRPLAYAAIRRQIMQIANRAGIEKRINHHIFRHTRATLYLKNTHLTSGVVKKMRAWSKKSRMKEVYSHLSYPDVRSAILEAHGMQ